MEYHQVNFSNCVSWTDKKCQVSDYSGDWPAVRELPQHVVEEDQEGGEEGHRVGEAAAPDDEHLDDGDEPDNEHVDEGDELADFPAVFFHMSQSVMEYNWQIQKQKSVE